MNKNNECLNSDIISTLPQHIIENILCLMRLRDALRTSILSKKWRYTWRSMPKLVFTDNLVVKAPYNQLSVNKYKLVNAIFHVLLLHNNPIILVFTCNINRLHMVSEFEQILSYLSKGNKVKELTFINDNTFYKLPGSFFSLQGLERIRLQTCTFEPPLNFNGFSRLKSMSFMNVEISAQILQRFLSKCPLLEHIHLIGRKKGIEFVAAGVSKFTFVDLLHCVPLIKTLYISRYYMKMYDNNKLPVRGAAHNFLDPEDYADMNLDHLKIFELFEIRSNLPLVMDLVKLIMAKSPVLKKVRIELNPKVTIDEEVKMLRDLVLLPPQRASLSAKLIIIRTKTA